MVPLLTFSLALLDDDSDAALVYLPCSRWVCLAHYSCGEKGEGREEEGNGESEGDVCDGGDGGGEAEAKDGVLQAALTYLLFLFSFFSFMSARLLIFFPLLDCLLVCLSASS